MSRGYAIFSIVLLWTTGCLSTAPYDTREGGPTYVGPGVHGSDGSPTDTATAPPHGTHIPSDTETTIFTDTEPGATSTRPDTESESETVLPAFFEGFDGSTVFKEIPYPMGDLHACLFPDGVSFTNDGMMHIIELLCYDEAALSVDLDLPEDEYRITVAWSTGEDNHTREDCERSGFHETYGSSCTLPNRIIVLNGKLVHETPGPLWNVSEVTEITHTGAIVQLLLGAVSAGESAPYITRYDYVKISPI
jgi:hypothetical protein